MSTWNVRPICAAEIPACDVCGIADAGPDSNWIQ